MKEKSLLICFLALLFASCSGESSKKASSPEADTAKSGTALYTEYCTSCHGEDGKMGLGGAKDLSISVLSAEEIAGVVANGSANKKMMAYGKLLSEEEIKQLSQYVLSLRQ